MAFLDPERVRLVGDIEAAGARLAVLAGELPPQQQAVQAAGERVSAAQARLAEAQAQVPPLQQSAASADRRTAAADQELAEHSADEPDQFIEIPNRPNRPNPAWRIWKRTFDQLSAKRADAAASAAAAHGRLDAARGHVTQAAGDVGAMEQQALAAAEALAGTEQAIAAATGQRDLAQAAVVALDGWNAEIVRDPLARPALEQAAAALSAHAAILEHDHAVVRVRHEIASETLASLNAGRDRTATALDTVNGRLTAAQEELRVAQLAVTTATRRIQLLRRRGPQ